MTKSELISKYNVPAPRYTSYPTVPYWDNARIGRKRWFNIVKKTFDETNAQKGISLYIHLPFCESLCTYCGCNTRITKNHSVEEGYIEAILAEWRQYLKVFGDKPVLRELHLGGGTPTFFKPENLAWLVSSILKDVNVHPRHDFGFEGHPNNTTARHLTALYNLGFRRVSFGIQDLDLKVQVAIHRIQPYEKVKEATQNARQTGYTSVNFDLIYGLPFQTSESLAHTIDKVGQLKPDRIAFYSYAHVPWMKPGQRGYSERDLPDMEQKNELCELGKAKFLALGYRDVGMDHYALPADALYKARENEVLHRNFMGYTVCNTELLIGLGTSAISDAKYGYAQNEKVVEKYKEKVLANELAIFKGHFMTDEDLLIRKSILNLLCSGWFVLTSDLLSVLGSEVISTLQIMEAEKLLTMSGEKVVVTALGKTFVRNVAMALDARLHRHKPEERVLFSKAI